MLSRRVFLTSGLAMPFAAHAAAPSQPPLIIGHRGAPGHLPEHTLPGYELAIRYGADFIEPDVVATKDGHLVVRHDAYMSATTDVVSRPEFADRKRTRLLDGIPTDDFFVCDFTLAEIKTLRARQAFADRDHSHDGLYEIVTLQQVIDLAQAASKTSGRMIGVYPEIKHSSFHASLGLPIEDRLLDTLQRAGLTRRASPVIIQSFEQANLKSLRRKTDVRLMQLISGSDTDPRTGGMILNPPDDKPYDWTLAGRTGTYADLLTPDGVREVATYADVLAPWKAWLLSFAGQSPVRRPDIIANAHAAGLKVHSWTMRDDRLPAYYQGDTIAEYLDLFGMGVDGLFTDFADTGVKARDAFLAAKGAAL
ncbi:MAG: glycerophosphodiester phosphodiesterase [Asticcacaulis sp.]|uniref:glycerophosphodiester phosphodiesterase n=1 Tax=Asticcacaulis sp. TaxID=1872648 RepID=UPI003F7C8504